MKPDWRKPVWHWQGNFAKWAWLINTFLWKGAFVRFDLRARVWRQLMMMSKDYGMMRSFGLLELGRKWVATKMEKEKAKAD